MQLTLKPTDEFEFVDGRRTRLWKGNDQDGTDVHAYLCVVQPQTHDPKRLQRFDRALQELSPSKRAGAMRV